MTAVLLAVDPVPWARAQMAWTLGVHIIIVPLGVSWAFMTLIANYRAIKFHDDDALELAQRWSRYMGVVFAVGAVTGTVLSLQFGLLWPKLMGRFGAAFGIPFAIEGLFFFTEAIFIAIYVFGWKRLKPWAHFWSGVPIVIAGIGGAASVVAANAWMNEPQGFTLDQSGQIVDVDPIRVIFNDAFPYEAVHMIVAAYVVGGFLVASVYAMGILRGRRDRYHRLGFITAFSVAAIAAPVQLVVGDVVARWVFDNEPTKFAAIELVPNTDSDVPETILGHFDDQGARVGGIRIPGLASVLSDPSNGTSTVIQGLNSFPQGSRPTPHEASAVHLAWDVMIGGGTLLAALSAWYWASWIFRRRLAQSRLFLWPAAFAGVLSIACLEAGWVVTEVGRQPWIVVGHMRVDEAATTNTAVWVPFLAIVVLYVGLAITTVLVLRLMSRRFRERQSDRDVGGPYEPRPVPTATLRPDPARV
jgi:cytochrome bd ubiquinol oxidase subunit I